MNNQCIVKHKDYNSKKTYTWCTNCGNYGIHGALKNALSAGNISPTQILLCFDIGCNGNGSDKIEGYTVHTLHGRVLPFATGAALANPKLPVIAFGGDGGTLGEGINHLIHAIRNDIDITFILHNNSNFGLTTGQASPTTPTGSTMNSTPGQVELSPINVSQLALSLDPSFYARGYSSNFTQLTQIITEGIKHKGFSLIEVLQDCPTYNEATPHQSYLERIYDINEVGDYDKTDIVSARDLSADLTDRIATGVLYQCKKVNRFTQTITSLEHSSIPINDLLSAFM